MSKDEIDSAIEKIRAADIDHPGLRKNFALLGKSLEDKHDQILKLTDELNKVQGLLHYKDMEISELRNAVKKNAQARETLQLLQKQFDEKIKLIRKIAAENQEIKKVSDEKTQLILELKRLNDRTHAHISQLKSSFVNTETKAESFRQSLLETEEKNKIMMEEYLKLEEQVQEINSRQEKD